MHNFFTWVLDKNEKDGRLVFHYIYLGGEMKSVKRNRIRPTSIADLVIRPAKMKNSTSIRPARSLRKEKLQVSTPIQAIFNNKVAQKED